MSEQQLGYGVSPQDSEVTTVQMPAGIHENVLLTNISAEGSKSDGTGDPVLRFYFEDANGLKFNHTEFPITEASAINFAAKIPGRTAEEVMAREFKEQSQRIYHILKTFIPADQLVIKKNSWEEYRNAVVETAGIAYKSIPLKIKLVLNRKDYVSFPRVPLSPFVLRMDDPTPLTLTRWDRIVPIPQDPAYAAIDKPDSGASVGTKW